jgi:glycine/D-amino acid oxidase-like deaminating enzyme
MQAPAEHTSSYYAATINDPATYPPLADDADCDVCIIGGGFSGISTAIFLAERGANVVLLEARRIGWGASGRNGGQVNGGMQGDARVRKALGAKGAELIAALWYRGHAIIEERIRRFGIDCDYTHGYVEAAVKPRHLEALQSYAEELRAVPGGGAIELVDKAGMARLLGTDAYCGGLVDRRNAHCHPLNLCKGEARGAASLGVRIHEQTPVTGIRHGARPVVMTAKGRVTCRCVVLAGNAYHSLERRRLGGLLFPAGSYVIATQPLPEAVAARINSQNLAVSDSRIVLDYYRLSADRRLLFGGLCQYANNDPPSITGALRPRMLHLWPELRDVRIDFEWGGHIGIVISRVPLIGRSAPNVYFLQGYSGHGVNVTHIASEIVADAIDGRPERLEMFEKVRQWRLPAGPVIGSKLLALGMAYYRLKDAL